MRSGPIRKRSSCATSDWAILFADSIVLTARFRDLLRHHVDNVHVNGGQLFMSRLNTELAKGDHTAGKGLDWTIGQLVLNRGIVMLDFGPEMPPIPVSLGARIGRSS